MESQNTTSRLTFPDEENMLSESCTQTDSLSLPLTVDLGTQTDETDSLDQSENATGSFVIDATDSVSAMSARKKCTGFWFLVSSREALMENMFIFWIHENNVNDNVTLLAVTKFSCLLRSRYKK